PGGQGEERRLPPVDPAPVEASRRENSQGENVSQGYSEMTRSIAVHSYKGGTGKTTITANVAVALALKGRRVGVMDMDLEGPGLHVFFDLDPSQLRFTVNDVLVGVAPPEAACVRMSEKMNLNG